MSTKASDVTSSTTAKPADQKAPSGGTRVNWDTSNLKSSYANVCTMTSTREEVVLNFGINQAWERSQNEMQVELTDRIILSPFAAQRLLDMLGKLMTEYEGRYGGLKQDIPAPASDTKQ